MDVRDSESSTDEELLDPPPLYGSSLRSNSTVAAPAEPAHVPSIMAETNDTASSSSSAGIRSSLSAPSSLPPTTAAYESSIFSAGSTAISRPNTPNSPPESATATATQPTSNMETTFQVPIIASISPMSSRNSVTFDPNTSMLGDATLTAVEKDGDDPTLPLGKSKGWRPSRHATPTALTRLLASRVAASPEPSRESSYVEGNPNLIRQVSSTGGTSLHDHLYRRGLLEGKHSDIAVLAFGHRYNLHRLILDRAPFFTTALSEPWLESKAKEVVLRPEEIDPTITQKAFELALKRLYGCSIRDEEDAEAVGLFTTACWLEMPDLVSSATESILRQMGPDTLAPLIRLVTTNYYGRAGDRILASAKAMLCREGWEMPVRYWDDVPGETVREIVGGDGFYVSGEWERWVLAKRLLDRRLRMKAGEYGLATQGSRNSIPPAPEMLRKRARRASTISGHSRTASLESNIPTISSGKAAAESQDIWTAIYTDPDVEPILVLMDQGIHYVHLDFERLQYIRGARDVFGLPVLPEHVVSGALWLQMELRQRVVNARESDLELGLSQAADIPAPAMPNAQKGGESEAGPSSKSAGKVDALGISTEANDEEEAEPKPRKFWIPSADCNIVMGGNAEPVITTNAAPNFLRLSAGVPAGIDAADILWASNFARPSPSSRARQEAGEDAAGVGQPTPVAYSKFPPFRFAAEFPNPRALKEKKRVYSRTVFYAGSHWNIYIQKVRSQKNPQLGVYLHRAKEREADDGSSNSRDYLTAQHLAASSVDERIGLLEREMLLRSSDGGRRSGGGRRSVATRHSDLGTSDDAEDSSYQRRRVYGAGEGTVLDTSFTAFDSDSESEGNDTSPTNSSGSGSTAIAPSNSNANFFEPTTPSPASGPSLTHFPPPQTTSSNASRPRSLPAGRNASGTPQHGGTRLLRNPTLPSYTDARPTIKTYFKIYSPSRGGRLLSVYESAPDRFDFSQSWGWKSSTLMLDEGFEGNDNAGGSDAGVGLGLGLGLDEGGERDTERKKRKEGALRFMVVIGNL